jgi:hypothetical protein
MCGSTSFYYSQGFEKYTSLQGVLGEELIVPCQDFQQLDFKYQI